MEELSWLYIITAGQGFFLSIVLFIKKSSNVANRFLAIVLLFMSIDLCLKFDLYYNEVPTFFSFFVLFESAKLVYGPMLYLYTLFVLTYKKRFSFNDLFHLIPALLLFLCNLFCYLVPDYYSVPESEKLALVKNHLNGSFDLYDYIISFIIISSMMIYLTISIFVLRRYSKDSADYFSDLTKKRFLWLKTAFIAAVLCLIGSIAGNVGDMMSRDAIYDRADIVTSLLMCIILYVVGYFALTLPEIFALPGYLSADEYEKAETEKKEISSDGDKYIRTKIPDEVADEISREIREAMENEKAYLEPELTLDDFSKMINTPHHHVSQVINSRFGENFFMFVNRYRVDEAKMLLSDKDEAEKTILEIGLRSGFNSKTTFNSIFKKMTGVTPTEYRRRAFAEKKQ